MNDLDVLSSLVASLSQVQHKDKGPLALAFAVCGVGGGGGCGLHAGMPQVGIDR